MILLPCKEQQKQQKQKQKQQEMIRWYDYQ